MTANDRNRLTIDGVRGLLGLDPLYPAPGATAAASWRERLQASADGARAAQASARIGRGGSWIAARDLATDETGQPPG